MWNQGPLIVLALKQIFRHRVRSLLTLLGVGAGMFLFSSVETMQHSLKIATTSGAADNALIVYRENRFCPMTSRLPEHYKADISRIEGVAEVVPIQVTVNNCGASLDVITFRGVDPESLFRYNPELDVVAGSFDAWNARGDGALIGEHFAQRRGLSVGDAFEAVGVRVIVSGIVRSPLAQDNNVAYVHLPFLQQASRVGLGVVTQFTVRVAVGADPETVAERIDAYFASDSAPTHTRPEKAFFAQTAKDLIEMVGFTRWMGIGAIFGVMGLVANALLLAARGRVQEGAILQTLGFPRHAIGLIMIWEGTFLGLIGGAVGAIPAALFFHLQSFTLGNEGLTLALVPSGSVIALGLVMAMLLGLLASLWPAVLLATRPLVSALRES